MAKPNDKKTETNTEAKKVEKTVPLSVAGVFQKIASEAQRSHKEHAELIVKHLASKGVTTRRGFPVTVEKVANQCSAMIRDINTKRGEAKGSWWSQFTVDEKEGKYKIVPKPKLTV